MKGKLEKTEKQKTDYVTQLKSLFAVFTQQRKALEVSIQKTRRLEEDSQKLDTRNKTLEEQAKGHQRKVDQLEQERDALSAKFKREKDALETELDERRQSVKKYEQDFKEWSSQRIVMKKQLDEYESKIKRLILEFEETSKRHIKELNDVHE